MPRFRTGRIDSIVRTRNGIQHVTVDTEPAYVLTDVIGTVQVGDAVVMNTTAVDLGLGTGGMHVVHWNLSRSHLETGTPGHIVKARYLSEQIDVHAWEEGAEAELVQPGAALPDLSGVTVVTCLLHSHVGALATAIGAAKRSSSVAFVMTDWASLPLPLSNLMADLTSRGIIDLTVTAGQSFGGDVEAVTVASGILAAKQRGIDIVLVGPGPGHAGTGTALGFSALDAVGVVDVAAGLGARVSCLPRWSGTDERARHKGLSHHTTTVLSLLGRTIELPVPPGRVGQEVHERLLAASANVEFVGVAEPVDVRGAFTNLGVSVSSMGRSLAADPGALSIIGAMAAWAVESAE